jgi:diguanylate cyclase (GGDEF)-like protein
VHGSAPYVLFLMAASGISCVLAAYGFSRRSAASSTAFGLLMAASAVYCGGYAMELTQSDVASLLVWVRFEYLGIATLPAWWVLFAHRFSGGSKPSLPVVGAFLAIPLITIALVWTVGRHGLYYARMWMRSDGPFPTFGFAKGPWYWVHNAYTSVCFLIGNTILIRYIRRAGPRFRTQAILAAVASLAPWAFNSLYLAGLTPGGLDVSAFAVVLSGAVFGWAMFRQGFLDLLPVARERVLELMNDGMLVVDQKKRLVDANPAARQTLELGGSAVGMPLRRAAPKRGDLADLADAGAGEIEITLQEPEQMARRYQARAFPVTDDRGRTLGTALMIHDISETAALLDMLAEMAGTDELTGALNRRRFMEQAERELAVARRAGRPLSVIVTDLDHFKNINDSHGHAAGDAALRTAAARMREGLRTTDLFCRFGGEEFAALLPDTDMEGAERLAERLRTLLAESPIVWEGKSFPLTASFGVSALAPAGQGTQAPAADGTSLDILLRKADEAMYRAKMEGRNRVVRSPATFRGTQ